jgi:hypothetical protein
VCVFSALEHTSKIKKQEIYSEFFRNFTLLNSVDDRK